MLFLTGAGGAPSSYQINRSLRFNDDDSAHITRTPVGAGNRRVWTFSAWVKRGNIGTQQMILSAVSGNEDRFQFTSSDTLSWVYGGLGTNLWTSSAVFRDTSAWYHIVLIFDSNNGTAADRSRIFVNGVRASGSFGGTPTSIDSAINNTVVNYIGRDSVAAQFYFDGYLAEVHFVDGTALTPSSFGETDAVTGVWKPKRVSGVTYGTNGFYLSFNDNTSTTTLGYDDAGSNDWTLNNFSVAAGAGNDSLNDSPTNNYCTWNILSGSGNASTNGMLTTVNSSVQRQYGTIGINSGKWYFEAHIGAIGSGALLGVSSNPSQANSDTNRQAYYSVDGEFYNDTYPLGQTYGNTFTTSDIISIAYDADNGKLFFAKNGTWQNSGDPVAGTNPAVTGLTGAHWPFVVASSATVSVNFGQRAFSYTPPSGFSALCTRNLPTPAIVRPSQHFNAVTYTGTGSSLAITGVGHQPDLVWIKGRSGATDHALYDAVRGVQARLESNTTDAEVTTDAGLTAFGTDGFTVNTLAQVNTSTATYVGWCWKEGVTPGFDIVTYTGNGSNRTIAHSLGAAPHFMTVKARGTPNGIARDWITWHGTFTSTEYIFLNQTAAKSSAGGSAYWNSALPGASNFSIGTDPAVNWNGATYVAYLFTEIAGFSRFGSYTGNGSTDGVFVWTGFRPRLVGVKRTDTTGDWFIWDTARDSANVAVAELLANSSAVEAGTADLDILSNGFKLRATTAGFNANTGTYIFFAFAEAPFQYARAR